MHIHDQVLIVINLKSFGVYVLLLVWFFPVLKNENALFSLLNITNHVSITMKSFSFYQYWSTHQVQVVREARGDKGAILLFQNYKLATLQHRPNPFGCCALEQGSPNYGPWSKSGSRSHLIRSAETFCE